MTSSKRGSVIVRLALPIYLPSILMSFGMGMIVLILPLLAVEISGSYSIASLTFAMVGPGTLLADLPAGFLISRVGVRPVMLLGVVLVAISAFIGGLTGSALVLGGAGFILGAGRGLVMLARMTYIADNTSEETGQAMAAVGGAMRVGAFLGPIFGGFIAKFISYQAGLSVAGIIIACAAAFVGFLAPGRGPLSAGHKGNPFKSVAAILKAHQSIFVTAGTALVGLQLMRSARVLLIPLWGESIGLDAAEIGLITGIPMGLEMTMFYPVGLIMDRFGRKWTAVPCIAILAIALALIPLCHTFTTLMLVVLLAGIGNGLGSGIFLTLGADFSPTRGRSDFLGVWRLFGDTGHTTGPFLISAVTETFALAFASLSTAALGLISAFIMLVFVKESRNL